MDIRIKIKEQVYKILNPVIKLPEIIKISPNGIITMTGFIITIISSAVLVWGAGKGNRENVAYIIWFGIILLLAGVFDMLDDQLVRKTEHSD